jgi:hypothetical protein
MEALRTAESMIRSGHFANALKHLDGAKLAAGERLAAQTVRTQLLERVGRFGESSALARTVLASTNVHLAQRSTCEQVLGRIAIEHGQV